MRQFPAIFNQLLSEEQGTAPALVFAVNWGNTFKYFSTQDMIVNNIRCEPRILEFSNLTCKKAADNRTSNGNITVILDDSDGLLKTLIDITRTERAICGIYFTFIGTGIMSLIMEGKVCSPIVWSEGNRTLTIEIETDVETPDIGFSIRDLPLSKQQATIPSQIDAPWPYIFGKCAHVPCTQTKKRGIGKLRRYLKLNSDLFIATETKDALTLDINVPCETQQYNDSTEEIEDNKFEVDDGDEFLQDTPIQIKIKDCIFKGSFHGTTFTVTEANCPYDTDLALTDNTIDEGDKNPSNEAYKVCFISTTDTTKWPINLIDKYVEIKTPSFLFVTKIIRQEGAKCWFKTPCISSKTYKPFKVGKESRIVKTYFVPPNGMHVEDFDKIIGLIDEYVGGSTRAAKELLTSLLNSGNTFWDAEPGIEVTEFGNRKNTEEYIISCVPVSEVNGVYYRRKEHDLNGKKDVKIFLPLPKNWYTLYINGDSPYTTKAGSTATIVLKQNIKELAGDDADENIYVTATSTVGPNPVDIIEWVIINFTNYFLDGFNTARNFFTTASIFQDDGNLENEAHFAYLERKSALKFAQDIAWQARCSLFIDSKNANIRYLNTPPDTVLALDEYYIEEKSASITFVPTTDLTTRLIGKYKETNKFVPNLNPNSLTGDKQLATNINFYINLKESEKELVEIYTENIDIFGVKDKEITFTIWNNQKAVLKSLRFWGKMYARSWTLVKIKLPMLGILLQAFDGIRIVTTTSGFTYNILGRVQELTYDFNNKGVDALIWLPMVAGEGITSADIWDE